MICPQSRSRQFCEILELHQNTNVRLCRHINVIRHDCTSHILSGQYPENPYNGVFSVFRGSAAEQFWAFGPDISPPDREPRRLLLNELMAMHPHAKGVAERTTSDAPAVEAIEETGTEKAAFGYRAAPRVFGVYKKASSPARTSKLSEDGGVLPGLLLALFSAGIRRASWVLPQINVNSTCKKRRNVL